MSKMKKLIIALVILIFVIFVIPVPRYYKDGGTIEYRAVLYQVICWHRMMRDGDTPSISIYYDGLEVRILGKTVYDNTAEMEYRYCG